MTDATTSIDALRSRFPWPARRPDVPAVPWVMDYGGRDLIKHLIATRKPRVILEIGAFVGGSVRQWLEVSPDVTVVAIDPWPQKKGPDPFCDAHPIGRLHSRQLREPDGLYHGKQTEMHADMQADRQRDTQIGLRRRFGTLL